MPTCAVVGAGLVGCLTSIMLAQRGWQVTLYELRPDPRIESKGQQLDRRSINLAISNRGISALDFIDENICKRVMKDAIPMKGRMIHPLGGTLSSQAYGLEGECINSIDRAVLNASMLDEIDNYYSENITIQFEHKFIRADFETGCIDLERKLGKGKSENVSHEFDLIVGADGSFSKVRQQLMRILHMDFKQTYIDQTYVELHIPPGPNNEPLLDLNHLHIWPRKDYMLIALPNKDMSFTSTLFAPLYIMDQLQDRSSILNFFKQNFPDALPLFGDDSLVRSIEGTPRWPLLTIECRPYHYKDRAIILGDAAHSMVPFYGQGMNCGFEDVRVLANLLDSNRELEQALDEYTKTRYTSLVAICQLALRNYDEMASGVVSKVYLIRKQLDGVFAKIFRGSWLPLYTMVTFRENLSYAEALQREQRQHNILESLIVGLGVTSTVGLGLGLATAFKWWKSITR